MSRPLLEIRDLLMQFQGLTALDRVTMTLDGGSITSLTVSYTHLTLPTKRIV